MTEITNELIENFFDNIEDFNDQYSETIESICNQAYDDNAVVDYYIPGYVGDWNNPPEAEDYGVSGYDEYMTGVIDGVVECVAKFLNIIKNEELVEFVREHINEIIDIDFISFEVFERNAVEDYLDNM